MQIYDFITEEEIDELPEDNQAAFLAFVKISRRRLADATSRLDASDELQWNELNDARHGFMNIVTAAARRYEVEPFASMNVPRIGQFANDEHRQFTADLDHYMTQLLLNDGTRSRRDSVALSETAKTRIRTHLHHLREQIGKEDMPQSKRKDLLDKLSTFEESLDKRRLSLLAVARLTVEILAVPGALGGSYDIATKLLSNVVQTVAQEKGTEGERAQRIEPPAAVLPPRPSEVLEPSPSRKSSELDDIPF
ncbi:hypothetical protein RHEC894_CH01810 [Rhizobium sp. CIAT894]|uniref:hypothetical protein n=1 Tax=Rhizobium sp. CIAT894 TaxID=2020312 RepID=UPI000A1FC522|nr:hypothetical protein [Rhizobium sp. CIAT894]ARM88123.1 hypothetical protein RHEC894_CH01810 [Rhizobium sp. CIAT894]